MLEARHISKWFGAQCAVNDVSFTLPTNTITGLLGPNGAGKTTTIKLLTGLESCDAGSIYIQNQIFLPQQFALKARMGYLPESVALYAELTVLEHLFFFGKMHALKPDVLKTRLKTTIADCQLQSVLTKKCGQLSKGFRQRTGLAQALLHDPDILILDEPTEGLDPLQILDLRRLLQRLSLQKTILVSSHILQEIAHLCQHLIIFNNGKVLAQGALNDFGNTTEELEKKFLELMT